MIVYYSFVIHCLYSIIYYHHSFHYSLPSRMVLKKMLEMGEESRKKLTEAPEDCRLIVSYSRSSLGMSFENLPLMSIVLKKVTAEYPSVVYSIERMTFTEERCSFVLLFSEDHNWVKILTGYESNIEVCREGTLLISRTNSHNMLLDL